MQLIAHPGSALFADQVSHQRFAAQVDKSRVKYAQEGYGIDFSPAIWAGQQLGDQVWVKAMNTYDIESLLRLELLIEDEARRLDWLRDSSHRDLQLAAMRAWPRYECLVQIYTDRCRAAGRVPRVPAMKHPVVIRGGKNRSDSNVPVRFE